MLDRAILSKQGTYLIIPSGSIIEKEGTVFFHSHSETLPMNVMKDYVLAEYAAPCLNQRISSSSTHSGFCGQEERNRVYLPVCRRGWICRDIGCGYLERLHCIRSRQNSVIQENV